jgi:hypothetical protein
VKSTSGKHLTTVACNDYALKTFEEAWESNRAEVVLLHESVSIRPVFFISQSQNECHVPAGIIWLSLLFQGYFQLPPDHQQILDEQQNVQKYFIHAVVHMVGQQEEKHKAVSLERVDRSIHYSIKHGIRMQNGEQKRDTLTSCDFHRAKCHHCTKS